MAILISASILSADFLRLGEEITRAENSGADMLHFDVMDGAFVDNISFGLPVLAAVKKFTKLPLDVHLMIAEPLKFIEAFAGAGADIITFHAECGKISETIEKIHSLDKKAGLSIKPNTSLDEVVPFLDKLQNVLIMTVEPGFGGQAFLPETVEKIKKLRELSNANNYKFSIQVDGGINEKTAPIVIKAGADNLVTGSYLFSSSDTGKAVESIRITKI